MGPVFGVWQPIKPKLLRRVHGRLAHTGGCTAVRYDPSRRDANEVGADVDPRAFLERESEAATARLRVEFGVQPDRPHYWIQWWEPQASRGFGWHADDTEPEYGPVHLHIEHPDGAVTRHPATHIEDEHPYRTFERRLTSIPATVDEIHWE